MNKAKSIIQKWNILIEDLKTDMLNKELFADVVRETYYYFKEVNKIKDTDKNRIFTTEERDLFKVIFAFSHQDDPVSEETKRLYHAAYIVATMLEGVSDVGDYRTHPFLRTYMSTKEGSIEFNYYFEYNVDIGDLSDIIDIIEW